MVCRSKEEGGLGVINIRTQNEALLVKHRTNSSTEMTPLGSPWFGKNIMNQESFLVTLKRVHFGGGAL